MRYSVKVFPGVRVYGGREPKAARLSLRLIREALSQPPGALHRVLKEVLDLTPEQLADFGVAGLPAGTG